MTNVTQKEIITLVMGKAFYWIKTHKLSSFLILILFLFIVKPLRIIPSLIGSSRTYSTQGFDSVSDVSGVPMKAMLVGSEGFREDSYNQAAPAPDVVDRKVVLKSNFSLLVKNVTDSVENIKNKTQNMSGYLVNMKINRTEYSENATIQIRIPSEKVDEMSKFLRNLAVKVVSENVDGKDVTDQYIDVERRISDLEKQRVRVEVILDAAKTVDEMIRVQNQLFQIQDQIDSYKGKLLYMDGTTKTSLLSIYISTDELSLPYAPSKPWRPEAVFKQAVRSLLGDLQGVGSLLIWLVVYSPFIISAIIVIKLIKRLFRKKLTK